MLKEINSKELIEHFIDEYCSFAQKNKEDVRNDIQELIHYFKNRNNITIPLKYETIAKKWYNSLSNGSIDYSIYNDEYYNIDLIICFVFYSKKFLLNFDKNSIIKNTLTNINCVVDVGCGLGYTTSLIKEIFSVANVYGTNIKDTMQYKFCKQMATKNNFALIENIKQVKEEVDLLIATDFFEHIERPIEYLDDIFKTSKPRYLYIANSFNTYSPGHFIEYKDGDKVIEQKKIVREFNNFVRKSGFTQIKAKIWNNKPTLWELKS